MKWLVVGLLAVQAHFAVSMLVPLEGEARDEFGGLLRWLWPWEVGQGGLFGQITTSGPPGAALLLMFAAAGLSVVALLSVIGVWVPPAWWRGLTIAASALTLLLMVVFLGPTKLLPILMSLILIWAAWSDWVGTAG